MRTKTTLILLFLNVSLFLYIFYIDQRWRGDEALGESSRKVFGQEVIDIDFLEISGAIPGGARVITKSREGWRLSEPIDWPANPFAVSQILNNLQFIERETSFRVSELAKSGQSLDDYGLEDPRLVLTFGRDGTRHEVRIGEVTEIGNRLYILGPRGERVHVVSRDFADSLSVSLAELRSDSVFNVPLFEVRSLSLQIAALNNLRVRLSREGQHWSFETPIRTRADRNRVEAAINKLNVLKIAAFEPPGRMDLASYGLQSPAFRITLEGNARRESLLVGNATTGTNGDPHYYAKVSGNDTVFRIPAGPIDELKEAQEKLRDRRILRFDPEALTTLEISQPGVNEVVLQRLETGQWQVVVRHADESLRLLPAETSAIKRLTERLSRMQALSFANDAPSSSDLEDYGLTEPQRTIVLDGDTRTILLVGVPTTGVPDTLYAQIEGSSFVYTVDPHLLREIPADSRYYRNRQLLRQPEGAAITSLRLTDLKDDRVLLDKQLDNRDGSWRDLLTDAEPQVRNAVLDLLPELRTLRVRSYHLDEFPSELQLAGERRPWRYHLHTGLSLRDNDASSNTGFDLFFTERMGATGLLGGSPGLNVVFHARQNMIDTLFAIIEDRPDPGPPPSLPPAPAVQDEAPSDTADEKDPAPTLPDPQDDGETDTGETIPADEPDERENEPGDSEGGL